MAGIPFDVLTVIETGEELEVAADLVIHENTWEAFGAAVDDAARIALTRLFAGHNPTRVRMAARGYEEARTHEGDVIVKHYSPGDGVFELRGTGPLDWIS